MRFARRRGDAAFWTTLWSLHLALLWSQTSNNTVVVVGAWSGFLANPFDRRSSPPSTTSSTTSQQNPDINKGVSTPTATKVGAKCWIRSTQITDLPQIANMLATASTKTRHANNDAPWNSWKSKMGQLWAKSDIELLLTCRHKVLQEGKKSYRKTQHLLQTTLDERDRSKLSESDYLRILWTQSSDSFRTNLEKAAHSTGEDNVWKNHNMNLPPKSISWLNHIQLTAVQDDQRIIGFCEIAMLWSPSLQTYTPAITNLATDVQWRRRGVATRLLQTASRYVSLYWSINRNYDTANCDKDNNAAESTKTVSSLGLYVEKDNRAAIALYEKLGFAKTVTCDGGDHLNEMWYMTKELPSGSTYSNAVVHTDPHQQQTAEVL